MGTTRRFEEVAPGVLVATSPTWSTTTTVVLLPDDGCLVVDPAVTPAEVDGVADALAARRLAVVGGFATHPHWDHVLWSARWRAPRWATPLAATTARRTHADLVGEAEATAPGHDPALLGELTAFEGRRLPLAREVLVVPHGAHAPGAAALVVPDAGVLLAGDMLSDTEVPLLDVGAPEPVTGHLAALDALEAAAARHGVGVLVPGHGTVTDGAGLRARLAADRAYLRALAPGGEERADPGDRPDASDPRLTDTWVADQHRRQVAALRRG